ncbi:NAD-dependent epimerase/dehydratase family protein [Planosporangium thailandense]|uniref:NAD-dependent epimerase/dehydratase family protein n=1 Tax=Planosporangium thailandense TaxID=765197 RepID=A0ABX0Y1Z6_9ACTN|nr:NAD-dependent epimerase/dehydratase family protein [Planosporangium thailandense]
MRLAVTGASGFCGAAVARAAAAAGMEVVCLGRRPGPGGRHVPWDAARDTPELAGVDGVVHLAAAVGDPPPGAAVEAAFRRVNVDGTARLMTAAGGRPVVYVSSASVYAPGRHERPLTEEHQVGGQRTAYGRTKAEGEALALAAGAVALRPRAVYGPGDPHLLPRLRRAVRAGVALLPGPDTTLSLTAVENLADACLAALAWPSGAYNIADATVYHRDDAVRRVLAALGTPARLVHVPTGLGYAAASVARVAGRLRSTPPALTRYAIDQLAHGVVLDIARATALGWRPRHDLDGFTAWLRTVDPVSAPTVPGSDGGSMP